MKMFAHEVLTSEGHHVRLPYRKWRYFPSTHKRVILVSPWDWARGLLR